ncbi:MAG: asparaginase domain-containing protein [Rhodothermales bacterium]
MNIAILYTGGTIGCVGDPLRPLSKDKFESAFEAIISPIIATEYPDCTLSFLPFDRVLDSTNIQPADWCDMAEGILPHYANYDGFIVLHGTDTMAFTASALSFLFTGLQQDGFPNAVLSKPIVFTGSQVPLFHENEQFEYSLLFNTDALQNVCGAIAAAQLSIPEVCLYFNDTLFRGNRTVKTNADEFHAFSSPNYPALASYGIEFVLENDHILHLATTQEISLDSPVARLIIKNQLDYLKTHINHSTIIPFLAFPAFYSQTSNTNILSEMLEAAIEKVDVDGVILESYGEGNFPSGNPDTPEKGAIYKTLKAAHDKGIVLIDCTQVLDGVVNSTVYAAGSWLVEVGVVGAYDMTSIAALTKLIYLNTLKAYNGNNWDARTIARLMQTNITGEIMDVNRLDSRGKWYLGVGESIDALNGSASLVNDSKSGPLLKDAKGKILWRALASPTNTMMPGRLYMQGDGNLVFYDNSNTVLWTSDTASSEKSTSMLILDNGSSDAGIRLFIYNYAREEISRVLYEVEGL